MLRQYQPLLLRLAPCFCLCMLTLLALYHLTRRHDDETNAHLPISASSKQQTQLALSRGSAIDLSALDAPFISWPLARVCSEAHWTPGIVFLCDNNSGGIGNIRNAILTCLRYAIEAGATGLVLPTIRTRSEKDLAAIWQEHRPFDYFFDETHFKQSLAAACPQMVIYPSVSEILGVYEPEKFEPIRPKEFGALQGGCNTGFPNMLAHSFGERFRSWVTEKEVEFQFPPLSQMDRRVFRITWGTQFEWPVWSDGPEFVVTFGGLLKFRPDILELGSTVAALMREHAAHRGDKGFVGMHLRSEHDALRGWPSALNQTSTYLLEAWERGFHSGYLATGNATHAEVFKDRALRESTLYVVTKEDLLEQREPEQALYRSLTWDQRALIDFIALAESDYFLGMNPSSFSMNVALKRHLQQDGIHTRPWKVGKEDGRSRLVGDFQHYWDSWLWFYDTMWP
jgi:hypothetical protein